MRAQMRMRLFEWEHIDDYKNILYIDTDVLIDGNVSKVFDVLEKDVVYGLQEGTTASEYFGRSLFPNRRKRLACTIQNSNIFHGCHGFL